MENFNTESELRKQLKVLLYLLARENEQPGQRLQSLVQEVIDELYHEVATATARRKDFRVVAASPH